jgi:hypothetical protein
MIMPVLRGFRQLYDDVLEYEGPSFFDDVLLPWVDTAQQNLALMTRLKTLSVIDWKDPVQADTMWQLYALGRVNDALLLRFQTGAQTRWQGPRLTLAEYVDFFDQVGLSVLESNTYSPFHHEIVQVQQSRDDQKPITILRQLWPGLMFGDMVFSRSGVEVLGGRNHVVKEIAEQSTLYFSHRRKYRKTYDLSVGWGHNSQWATVYRRDYVLPDKRVYNADGEFSLNAPETWPPIRYKSIQGLPMEKCIDLCRNRCCITLPEVDDDWSPFLVRYEEPIP